MSETLKQTYLEATVDELFERSDKIIHGLFEAVLKQVRMDWEESQKKNETTD